MPWVDACPCPLWGGAAIVDSSTNRPLIGVHEVITALAVGIVLVSFIVIAIAVADTARFARRTGNQVPADLAYRAYLA